ncbi:right-handed parallel beta-helix repeat-containing protein [Paenibacillus montanisoli]|uniref:Right-handed parallel beta-helix repeat-containing protein n=1 Tax=Paenibacillus montanisoli TaxID=2081970 RepID=A0A328UAC8_9BACL|nr:right-handed parallel beta-helix repeat-containing protein [Paenibacillus montanisoli]RAP77006.1 right-handed parallel beta-helix repeat-containing protein [Paenibacillus montanisoli]
MEKIFHIADFGAKPDLGEDAVPAFLRVIEAAGTQDCPVKISLTKGRYDFYPEHAAKVPYYVSNTASETENPDVTKTVGIWFKGIKNVTLDGNGSLFVFHGKMTPLVIDSCEHIEIRNLSIDFERATMSELEVEAAGPHHLDVRVKRDSWYAFDNSELFWVGEGWRYQGGPAGQYDPANNTIRRIPHPVMEAVKIEELEPNRLRLHYATDVPETKVGNIFQLRDGIRDQVGAFVVHSRDVTWSKVGMHFMHGLGIVCQFSENVSFDEMSMKPRVDSGRTCAGFADLIHVSGCRGLIRVENSDFEGAHDDAINVHGTHLRIVDRPSPYQIVVRFMHGQSYGFEPFFAGDEIEFIRARSLTAYSSNTVQAVQRLDARDWLLTLDNPSPDSAEEHDVVENVTWTPQVTIRNNRFARIPTRGILVTTRRKVLIENNRFERTGMSAILIADDAESWFESGLVRDVTIRNNRFVACGDADHPVILVAPENREVRAEQPVHLNIRIEENVFEQTDADILHAKSTSGLYVLNNEIAGAASSGKPIRPEDAVSLLACSDVVISGNRLV